MLELHESEGYYSAQIAVIQDDRFTGLHVGSDGAKGDRQGVETVAPDEDIPGSFWRPELSFDGKRVLVAYARHYPHVARIKDKVDKDNLPEDAFYHLYEMNLDGSGLRQLTDGPYDDIDPIYLPDGNLCFLTNRRDYNHRDILGFRIFSSCS